MKVFMQYLMLRLFELVVPTLALSALICGFSGFIPTDMTIIAILVSASAFALFVLNFFGLRHLYNIVPQRDDYIKAALAGSGIYIVLSAAVYLISNEIFTWAFLPLKFMHFWFLSIRIWMSAGIFHAVILLLIPLARLGVSRSNPEEVKRVRKRDSREFLFFFMDLFSRRDADGNEIKTRRSRAPLPYIIIGFIMDKLSGKRRRKF